MSLSYTCIKSFARKILADMGVKQSDIDTILDGLEKVVDSFEKNKSDDAISSIVTTSVSTFSNIAKASVDELSDIIVGQFIVAIIVVAVVVIILSITLVTAEPDTSFAVCIVVLILFALSMLVLYWFGKVQTEDLAKRTETAFKSAISSTYSRLISYEEQQSKALSEAFCAY